MDITNAGTFPALFVEKTANLLVIPPGSYNTMTKTYIGEAGERIFGAQCSYSETYSSCSTQGGSCKTDDSDTNIHVD